MQRTQHLGSGLLLRQDFRESARPVFFASDIPDFPFWTPGGTAFVVNYKSRPYVVTCAHIFAQAPPGEEPVITNSKWGNEAVRARAIHRVHDLDGGKLDADMGDVVVLALAPEVTVAAFQDSAYVIAPETIGTSERGDQLLVHGTLKQFSYIDATAVSPSFATLEFDDAGATSQDPFLREAYAKFDHADFDSVSGLSGSPVFNVEQNKLSGMVVRGGLREQECRVRYVDIFDIEKLLDSVHRDDPRVTYEKTVKRLGAPISPASR